MGNNHLSSEQARQKIAIALMVVNSRAGANEFYQTVSKGSTPVSGYQLVDPEARFTARLKQSGLQDKTEDLTDKPDEVLNCAKY